MLCEVDPDKWWVYLLVLVGIIVAGRTIGMVALARRAAQATTA